LACHIAYNDIRPIFFEEDTIEFSEHALRENRLQTFGKPAGDSAEKLTAITIVGDYTMGSFQSTAQFTAKTTHAGVVLSDWSYDYEHLPQEYGSEDDSDGAGDNYHDICLCRVGKAAAASNSNLLSSLGKYLEIDGVWKRQKLFLGLCYKCRGQIITCRRDWCRNPGALWDIWDTISYWPFDVSDDDNEDWSSPIARK
jgi:hypothetical protein